MVGYIYPISNMTYFKIIYFPLSRQDLYVAVMTEKSVLEEIWKLEYSIGVERERRYSIMIRILLACGIGASTGFMAANMRKIAKQQGIMVKVSAVSKSEVMEHSGEFDVLLLGPHFSKDVPKYREMLSDTGAKVMSIDPDYYATLDGEGVLEDAIELYNNEN